MRNYFLILILVSLSMLSACGTSSGDNTNANGNANTQPAAPQYADAKTAYDEGSKLFESGKELLAIEALNQAIALDPNMADAHFKLAMAYSMLEKDQDAEKSFEAAVDAYKKIIKENPDDAAAQFNLGRSYNKLNKDEDAEDALRRAVKLKPDDTGYNTEMGAILIKLAKYPEAITFLKKALEQDPDDSRSEELLEKAEDGRRRVEQGIPANLGGNKVGANRKTGSINSNTAADSNRLVNAAPPGANKKPEVKTTPKVIEPAGKKP